ncbi:uncharacterized protein TRUGW13939_07537 [Talaromyces rugulosus]|uniref:Major facilitator superfamily (MFS) profile domain-containing protein n=1 Tax=Talaromyces rugulosus TaxID=121627 RepID=A0A7H8R203_TALRU|nr:uncharacterized protein TRUGW13939_07537 [Talaromyces rugulosus]QKX60392.1 hypothetical protein TRUGW13939_07537 [Talaromyces rugulosus]
MTIFLAEWNDIFSLIAASFTGLQTVSITIQLVNFPHIWGSSFWDAGLLELDRINLKSAQFVIVDENLSRQFTYTAGKEFSPLISAITTTCLFQEQTQHTTDSIKNEPRTIVIQEPDVSFHRCRDRLREIHSYDPKNEADTILFFRFARNPCPLYVRNLFHLVPQRARSDANIRHEDRLQRDYAPYKYVHQGGIDDTENVNRVFGYQFYGPNRPDGDDIDRNILNILSARQRLSVKLSTGDANFVKPPAHLTNARPIRQQQSSDQLNLMDSSVGLVDSSPPGQSYVAYRPWAGIVKMAAALTKIKQHLRPSGTGNDDGNTIHEFPLEEQKTADGDLKKPTPEPEAAGVAKIQAAQAVWGRTGKSFLYLGLAMIMIIFELDNITVDTYKTYAASTFNELSKVATITTTVSIILAVVKPFVAKLSDVIGRGEAYIFTVSCYVLGYILCASSSTFNTYAGGQVFYAIGQGGMSVLDAIMVSDLSSMRWRGFSYNIIYLPFLIAPWISAYIVNSVVNGIGWRWGIGMFAILMPFSASVLIITLFVFQHRAKKAGIVLAENFTVYQFFSRIDFGGVLLLGGGFAMLLLPITLAATTTSKWKTPWVDALVALGIVALAALYPYERYVAKHPVVPINYFKNMSIVTGVLLAILDNIGFGITHTYLYPWSLVAHNFSARTGIFLGYTNGVMQALTGIIVGLVMYKTRSYKWLCVAGAAIRLLGYGVMIRLRTNGSSIAELFIVQLVQGLGSGVIETAIVVAAQIVVPHAELAQVTALISLAAYLGSAIGSAVAGGIYTDTLRGRLEYSDVMGYLTIAALALSAPVLLISFFMPNNRLSDDRNLVEAAQWSGDGKSQAQNDGRNE